MTHYDIIVLGSGGGSKITRPAADLGYKVAIIEEDRLGGTCLNRGCIPSKMLIHPADIIAHAQESEKFSITYNKPSVRFEELVTRVAHTIDHESDSIAPLYNDHPNITFYPYHGTFVDDKVIEVNGEQITADHIFLAPGAKASIPDIPGLKDTPFMTYKEALRNTTQPKSMLVIGAGYIAVELGYFYGTLGTDVHFIVRSTFLRNEDDQVSEAFTDSFSKRFQVSQGFSPTQVSYDGNEFSVEVKNNAGETKTLNAEALFVATGVIPNSDKLGLENTKITTDEKGYIQVDETLQTSVPGVYAMGDVIGRYLFRHSVNFEGEYLFEHVVKNQETPPPIEYPPMPHAVFSNPQIGGVGKTEQDLIKEGIDYVVGLNPYKSSAMGMALLSEEGFVKLLFEKQSKKLVGAHAIGEEASNMIHMCIAFMVMNATLDDMLRTIYIHPALPEIVRNAARRARKALTS